MKQLYPCHKKNDVVLCKRAMITITLLFITMISFSQGLVFKNPVLASGSAGNDGAVYRFSNVTTNVDALVTINGRSSTLVTLDTVDVTSTGWDKAFQPVVTYNHGNAKGPITWWMEFIVTFVQSGTSTPLVQDTLNATAIDVDGDGGNLQEQFTAYGTGATYTLNTPSRITVGSTTGGSIFTGPTTNSAGIDTAATKVMVTLTYAKVSSVKFRYGGTIANSGSSSSNRYNSIWFKTFAYTAAKVNTLPVMFSSFTAQLNNNNNKVLLNWATTFELNANHFVVQRSIDGKEFDDVAIVFAYEENSTSLRKYSYADDISSLNNSMVYYRLKVVDIDGNFRYTDVQLIRLSKQNDQSEILVYPNPAHTELRITIPQNWQGKSIAYNIYNIHGNLLKQKVSNSAGQTELMNISDLPVGMYIVKASNGNEISTQRIVKLNN